MTGVQTRRTGTGYKASLAWVIEQWIEMPNTHSDVRRVNPAGPESRTHNLPWEVFESVHRDYRTWQQGGKNSKKSAEAVVDQAVDGQPPRHPSNQQRLSEGPNL
jgi:hypothetical protein